MTLRVEEYVAWLEISVYEFPRMHILEYFENLVEYELAVDVLKDASPDDYV